MSKKVVGERNFGLPGLDIPVVGFIVRSESGKPVYLKGVALNHFLHGCASAGIKNGHAFGFLMNKGKTVKRPMRKSEKVLRITAGLSLSLVVLGVGVFVALAYLTMAWGLLIGVVTGAAIGSGALYSAYRAGDYIK
jgi:hypothetical protein